MRKHRGYYSTITLEDLKNIDNTLAIKNTVKIHNETVSDRTGIIFPTVDKLIKICQSLNFNY